MIVQANNFGQPWFPLFTSGPYLPVNPNKGHIHVTAETYSFGEVVYSQNEPSDHTKFWCKTTVSNDYAILGQLWWGDSANDTDFSRIEFGCSGVYKWDGEQWGEVEAVIWDGTRWNNANDKLGGVTLLLGAYYCEGWPKALDGVNAAYVYNDLRGPIGYAHWLSSYTQTVPRAYAGFNQGMYNSADTYSRFSGLVCPVEINGRVETGTSKIANSSDNRKLTAGNLLYYWEGNKYRAGKLGNRDATLVYQISCSETKPQRLTTPGYWIGVKKPTKLYVWPSKPRTAPEGSVLMGYGGQRTIKYSGLPGGGSIVSLNSCYVWKKGSFVALTKGTQWDFWDGTKWTGG